MCLVLCLHACAVCVGGNDSNCEYCDDWFALVFVRVSPKYPPYCVIRLMDGIPSPFSRLVGCYFHTHGNWRRDSDFHTKPAILLKLNYPDLRDQCTHFAISFAALACVTSADDRSAGTDVGFSRRWPPRRCAIFRNTGRRCHYSDAAGSVGTVL